MTRSGSPTGSPCYWRTCHDRSATLSVTVRSQSVRTGQGGSRLVTQWQVTSGQGCVDGRSGKDMTCQSLSGQWSVTTGQHCQPVRACRVSHCQVTTGHDMSCHYGSRQFRSLEVTGFAWTELGHVDRGSAGPFRRGLSGGAGLIRGHSWTVGAGENRSALGRQT